MGVPEDRVRSSPRRGIDRPDSCPVLAMTGSGGTGYLRSDRLVAQRLAGPRGVTAEEAVGHLLAVQAQDERGFRLAVRSRTDGLVAADVDRSLSDARSLVVTWLNRGTLHLVSAEDYWWLHPLTATRVIAANDRRLRQLGVDHRQSGRGVDAIVDALVADGPQTRHDLYRYLDAASVPSSGQIFIHLAAAASLAGLVVRGPVVDGAHAYVAVDGWLGRAPAPLGGDEALGRLARRYLTGHGPASDRDLAAWAGITLGDARTGLATIAGEIEEIGDAGYRLQADGATEDAAPVTMPPPRLLGPFDPLLHGWRSRELFVGDHAGVVTVNGIFRAVALVDGRVVATWTLPGGVVTIAPLERLAKPVRAALAEDAADVQRFLGLELRPVVFT